MFIVGFLFALASTLTEACGKTVTKFNFNRTNVAPTQLVSINFGVMALTVAVFVIVTDAVIPTLTLVLLLSLGAIVVLSIASNLYEFRGVKEVDLAFQEPLVNSRPVLASLLAFVIFPSEREWPLLVGFFLALFVVLWSLDLPNLDKQKRIGVLAASKGILLKAGLPVLFGIALEYSSAEYIALVRVVGVFIVVTIFKSTGLRDVSRLALLLGVVAGVIHGVGAVVGLYAIDALGVARAMALLFLGPALRYLFSYIFLKETVAPRAVISSVLLSGIAVFTVLIN